MDEGDVLDDSISKRGKQDMRERNFLCRERVKTNAHARSTAEAKNQDGASFVYVRIKEHLSKINTGPTVKYTI